MFDKIKVSPIFIYSKAQKSPNKASNLGPINSTDLFVVLTELLLKTKMNPVKTEPDPLSYPPCFRSDNLNPIRQQTGPVGPTLVLPVLDLQNLDASRLRESCENWGIFRLTNHGVPPVLSGRIFDLSKEIMAREFERKVAELGDDVAPVRYFYGTPAMKLKLKELNWLEGLHVSIPKPGCRHGDVNFGVFWDLASEYGEHMRRIARTIFNTMAMDLNLNKEQTDSYLSDSNGMFRAYRYPICPDPLSHLGMEAHTDSSLLTILNQEDVAGLQVFHNNEWYNVEPEPDILIVNLGDMMQAVSDDKYKCMKHRVLASAFNERFSLGYFTFPEEDFVINSLTYKPFTFKQFKAQVQEDIVTFGSKVGLKLFKKDDSKLDR